MSKIARTALLAAVGCVGFAASQSQAAVVFLNMADINAPIIGIMGFNGVAMQGLGGPDDLRVSLGAAVFPNAVFNTTTGWVVTSTLIADRDGSGTVTPGDSITANIGASTFDIVGSDGLLVHGSFNNAVLNTAVGSSSVNINSGNVNGLDLTPGPALITAGVTSLDPLESLGISLVNIVPGVQIAAAAPVPATPFFFGTMAPFGIGQASPSAGSVDMAAVVPEPASLGILGVGALGLLARRRRMFSSKLLAMALAAGAFVMVGSQAKAAPIFMDLSDIHAPIGGIAGFNGASFVSLGGVDNLDVNGAFINSFANAQFNITGGFALAGGPFPTVVTDANLNGSADSGEAITTSIGPGTFSITNPSGVLVTGSFTSATMSSSVGSTSVTINAGDTSGLDLVVGAALAAAFPTLSDLVDPESFSVNIVGISPGVSVGGAAVVVPGLLSANLNPFALGQDPSTSGSVNLVAEAVLVPEPASLGLLTAGALGLVARRRRA